MKIDKESLCTVELGDGGVIEIGYIVGESRPRLHLYVQRGERSASVWLEEHQTRTLVDVLRHTQELANKLFAEREGAA